MPPDQYGYTSYTPRADYFVPNCLRCGLASAGVQDHSALVCPDCGGFLRLIPSEHLKQPEPESASRFERLELP
jgi:DNA-directed RNA polymerase subunit RPC12/RpoP